jgi:hypothetical protein
VHESQEVEKVRVGGSSLPVANDLFEEVDCPVGVHG